MVLGSLQLVAATMQCFRGSTGAFAASCTGSFPARLYWQCTESGSDGRLLNIPSLRLTCTARSAVLELLWELGGGDKP